MSETTTATTFSHFLSKSRFIRGLQCHKALWLQTHHPELQDEVSASQQAVFDAGTSVGILAQGLYPGGVEVPYDGLTYEDQIAMTLAEIQKGTRTIYEATFNYDGIFCKVDILHHGQNGWELHEVKSSTGCKAQYVNDIGIQYYIVTGSRLKLSYAGLVHIENTYVRRGNIEVDKLFSKLDMTEQIKGIQEEIAQTVAAQREMLKGDEPNIEIGPHCEKPYPCPFIGHCWKECPENSVFDLSNFRSNKKWTLYREGIKSMLDVPDEYLGWRQKLQVRGLREELLHVDKPAIQEFLDGLHYPLCFMDFETVFMIPVPLWDGTGPYKHAPFQFSLHIIDEQGAEPRHIEFLSDGVSDPRIEFIDKLLTSLPPDACILVWNKTFERLRLQELAVAFPEKSDAIRQIIQNIRDLMVPFQDMSIYHSKFNGSYSIKNVLPALVPGLNHGNLDISSGDVAADRWMQMIHTESEDERDTLQAQLKEYCGLDTYAMIKILEEMQNMV